ncbi:MAG: Na(+)-translocating NADH-quinone reductase subunit C [Planctomycetes bacterium]|nr:Na(+)-translocating NADH-quinone reductase subunit C [Planctomycetota bacterium]MCH8193819.1 Na(+)-translocating NADH-quinone reductase subunit C [Planctomycetota bacterium]
MSQDSTLRTFQVATGICLVCSLFVSTAAVMLAPRQGENKRLDRIKNVLMAGHLEEAGKSAGQIYRERVEDRWVNLTTGDFVPDDQLADLPDPNEFDIKAMMMDSFHGEDIPADEDIARIKRRPKNMVVYVVKEGQRLQQVILPIYGKGLWSTLYGFLALKDDMRTVSGIAFYEHKETPGLGGEVDNAGWKASWRDKLALSEEGSVVIEVIKGRVDPESEQAHRQIDGLSGATITTRGVDQLVKYWLGEYGFGPFLKRLREER